MDATERVGLIGVGFVGKRFVDALAAADYPLTVYDVDPGQVAYATERGADAADSPAAVAAAADAVVLALPGAPEVRETLVGDGAVLETLSEGLVVDASTVGPGAAEEFAEAAREADVAFLTAPLTRGAAGGGIHFMCGGDPAVYEAASPLLDVLGRKRTRLGSVREAQTFKLLLQLRYAGREAVDAEVVAAARALDVDPAPIREFLGLDLDEAYLAEDFSPAIEGMGGLAIWRKDLGYLLALARETNTATPLAATVQEAYKYAARVARDDEGDAATILRYWLALNGRAARTPR